MALARGQPRSADDDGHDQRIHPVIPLDSHLLGTSVTGLLFDNSAAGLSNLDRVFRLGQTTIAFLDLALSDLARSGEQLLNNTLQQPGPLSLGIVLLVGALTSLGPCSLSCSP